MRLMYMSIAAACVLAACAGPAPPARPDLTADQFKSTIVGKRIQYASADVRYAVSALGGYKDDGTLATDWTSGGKSGHYTATWKMDGDKVCVTDTPANGGKTVCRAWRNSGGASYAEINPDGSLHGTSTVVQ
jgi:hypothetical protein